MSALGHKRTFALHQPMSALPPIATAKADFPQKSCPLYPQKQTCAVHSRMSALGQKRTFKSSFCTEKSGKLLSFLPMRMRQARVAKIKTYAAQTRSAENVSDASGNLQRLIFSATRQARRTFR